MPGRPVFAAVFSCRSLLARAPGRLRATSRPAARPASARECRARRTGGSAARPAYWRPPDPALVSRRNISQRHEDSGPGSHAADQHHNAQVGPAAESEIDRENGHCSTMMSAGPSHRPFNIQARAAMRSLKRTSAASIPLTPPFDIARAAIALQIPYGRLPSVMQKPSFRVANSAFPLCLRQPRSPAQHTARLTLKSAAPQPSSSWTASRS